FRSPKRTKSCFPLETPRIPKGKRGKIPHSPVERLYFFRQIIKRSKHVISGVLENLSRDYPEVKGLAQSWAELANLESKMRGAA
ncbi:hypothetical protein C3G32_004949, partial [Salmonella enterica subsp. enterica serovar Mbandaka]|nr:hypothetical protein [Salmonella enterica subsp. enterica serovar Mbandaka]